MNDSASPTRAPDDALLEMARWFLLSVRRHVRKEDWQQSSDSGLSEQQQYELANRFLAAKAARQSVRNVLREPALRNRLVGFARSRDVSKLRLSDSTKAYRLAAEFLAQVETTATNDVPERLAEQLVAGDAVSGPVPEDADLEAPGTPIAPSHTDSVSHVIPNRRAARRARFNPGVAPASAVQDKSETVAAGMSDEEYQRLEQAMASQSADNGKRNWAYQSNEDRFSLLSGLLAGVLFFGLVLWLFL